LKLNKLIVDGRTYIRMGGYLRHTLLGRLRGVYYLTVWYHYASSCNHSQGEHRLPTTPTWWQNELKNKTC